MSKTEYTLLRDNKPILTSTAYIDIVKYIHNNHCYSVQHALDHEGYSISTKTFEGMPSGWGA